MNLRNIKKCYFLIVEFLVSLVSLESVKEFFNDDFGGLVLPFSGEAINDEDWLEYQRLEADKTVADKTVKSINPDDLPSDFCDETCRLVDEFHKKTVNEKVEWMLYFDYLTGDVIYCWKGKEGRSGGYFDRIHFQDRSMASVHSHPKGYYSFPSPENFDILENEFEDYEIITSFEAMWIVEFKGRIKKEIREDFQKELNFKINSIKRFIELFFRERDDVVKMTEKLVGNYLLNDMEKNINDVVLVLDKKEFD